MAGPTFLVIGAQKSGTTWLHQNLQAHPAIWLPPEKELHFFDERIASELTLRDRVRGDSPEAQRWRRQVNRQVKRLREDRGRWRLAPWYARYFLGSGDVDWYRGLFARAGDRLAGEVTPDYSILDQPQVDEVARTFPDLRIVFIVRNPIERLWSHAQMQERLSGRDAEAGVLRMLDTDRPRSYGDYLTTLRRWGRAFGDERIWLGFMEDVANHPRAVLNGVTDHLGAPRHDRYPKAGRAVHKGGNESIPRDVATRLAEGLVDDVAAMASHLGGHARWWHWTATRLAEGKAPSEIRYPFWESELGDRAAGLDGLDPTTFHSGRYDEVRARAAMGDISDPASEHDPDRPRENLEVEDG